MCVCVCVCVCVYEYVKETVSERVSDCDREIRILQDGTIIMYMYTCNTLKAFQCNKH